MSRIYLLLAIGAFLSFSSCKKDAVRCDWQILDKSGTDLIVVRNKTEAELLACTDCGVTSSGQAGLPLGQILSSCDYYSLCDPKYCWSFKNDYILNKPEKIANCLYPGATKVDCNTCFLWYLRIKSVYIPTGNAQYSPMTSKIYCGDTTKLFNTGAQVVIRSTADSLIILEHRRDGLDWH